MGMFNIRGVGGWGGTVRGRGLRSMDMATGIVAIACPLLASLLLGFSV